MDNEKDYIEYLSSLNEKEYEKEVQEVYYDCVFYNDCDKCIHCFLEYEKTYCKLNCINFFERMKKRKNIN